MVPWGCWSDIRTEITLILNVLHLCSFRLRVETWQIEYEPHKNGAKKVTDFIGWQSLFAEMYSISLCLTRLILLWDRKCCIYFPAAVVAWSVDAGLVVLLHRYFLSWLMYSLQNWQNIQYLIELQYIRKSMPCGQALWNHNYHLDNDMLPYWASTYARILWCWILE